MELMSYAMKSEIMTDVTDITDSPLLFEHNV